MERSANRSHFPSSKNSGPKLYCISGHVANPGVYETPPFDRVIPTAENIACDIWGRLQPRLCNQKRRLHSVRVYETPDLFVDYDGEPPCSA